MIWRQANKQPLNILKEKLTWRMQNQLRYFDKSEMYKSLAKDVKQKYFDVYGNKETYKWDLSGRKHHENVYSNMKKIKEGYDLDVTDNEIKAVAKLHDMLKKKVYNFKDEPMLGKLIRKGYLDDIPEIKDLSFKEKLRVSNAIAKHQDVNPSLFNTLRLNDLDKLTITGDRLDIGRYKRYNKASKKWEEVELDKSRIFDFNKEKGLLGKKIKRDIMKEVSDLNNKRFNKLSESEKLKLVNKFEEDIKYRSEYNKYNKNYNNGYGYINMGLGSYNYGKYNKGKYNYDKTIKYQGSTNYNNYGDYKDYGKYNNYGNYNNEDSGEGSGYGNYNKYNNYEKKGYNNYMNKKGSNNKKILGSMSFKKQKQSYQPIMIMPNGKEIIKGGYFETLQGAVNEGMIETDENPTIKFKIRKVKAPEYLIKQGRNAQNQYKFKMNGNMYSEKRKYWKDKSGESSYNWMKTLGVIKSH